LQRKQCITCIATLNSVGIKVKSESAAGRPQNVILLKLFDSLCEWLENGSDDELHTLDELRTWMVQEYIAVVGLSSSSDEFTETIANEAVYSSKHLK